MKNKVFINGDVTKILIESKKHGDFYTYIDTEDLPKLKDVSSVHIRKRNHTFYAVARINNKPAEFHRLLFDEENIKGKVIDHFNHNGLDNRRSSNLRVVTQAVNSQNRNLDSTNKSGVRGVYFDKDTQKWRVEFTINKKRKRIGRYKTHSEAKKVAEDFLNSLLRK
jgi:hypothetical protein